MLQIVHEKYKNIIVTDQEGRNSSIALCRKTNWVCPSNSSSMQLKGYFLPHQGLMVALSVYRAQRADFAQNTLILHLVTPYGWSMSDHVETPFDPGQLCSHARVVRMREARPGDVCLSARKPHKLCVNTLPTGLFLT